MEPISRLDWVASSLDGDVEEACRIQELTSREERLKLDEWTYRGAEELLSSKPTPKTECPGFERLDAIMSIQPDKVETIKPTLMAPAHTAAWAAAMRRSDNAEGQ